MARGGKREGAGRKKLEPEVDVAMGKGFATRVLDRIHEADLKFANGKPINNVEDYVLDKIARGGNNGEEWTRLMIAHKHGLPVRPVIQKDTRELTPELDFGDLIMPTQAKPGTARKPN